ncbi:cytochrome c oxidase assembly factor 7B-like [Styela clava]
MDQINFKNEEEVKEYLQNTEIEFMFGCEKEFNSDSCARLGNFLEVVRKDYKGAGTAYKTCCQTYRNPLCCYKVGQFYMLGKGGLAKSQVGAFDSYRTACIQTKTKDEGKNDRIAASCCNMGLLLTQFPKLREEFWNTTKEKVDYSKADCKTEISNLPTDAVQAIQRSCDLNDAVGCNFLSQLYMTGFENLCKKDFKIAAKYAEKSCELGDAGGCHNLALMHERGDGVPKNQAKADEYKAKKLDLLKGNTSLQFGAH